MSDEPHELRQHLGAILKRERERHAGSTPSDKRRFATALDVTVRTLDRLEAGETSGQLEEYAAKYAWLLGMPNADPRPWWNKAMRRWQQGQPPASADLADAFAQAIRDQSLRSQARRNRDQDDDSNAPEAEGGSR